MPSPRRPVADAASRPLNVRQRRFVDLILAGIGPGEAATRAGYTGWAAAQSAYELARRPNVAAAIRAGRGVEAGTLTREAAIAELAHVAMSNILDYASVRGETISLDLSRLDRARAAGVRELIVDETYNHKTGETRISTRLRMGPKLGALRGLIPLLPTQAEVAAAALGQGGGAGTGEGKAAGPSAPLMAPAPLPDAALTGASRRPDGTRRLSGPRGAAGAGQGVEKPAVSLDRS
jgi:hypothetical protein